MIFETDYLFGLTKTLLTTFMTLLLMFVLTDFKYPKKKVLAIFSIYFVYVGLSSWLLINLLGWINFMRIFVLSISLPAVFIMYHVAIDHAMQAVFNYATQIDIALVLSVTATILNTALDGNRFTDLLIRFLLFASAFILEHRYVRKLFRKVADNLRKEWTVLASIPVSFCVLFLLCGLYPVHFAKSTWGTIHIYMSALVMICVYIAVFRSLSDSYSLLEAEKENDILETQISALKKEADTLFEYMGQKFSELNTAHYCDNPVLNNILTIYLNRAQKDGILIKTDLDIPTILPVDAIELATVFANAIENARDVLNQLPADTPKHLELRCVSHPKFVFEIANTCRTPVTFDGEGYPTRQNGQRGIRTQSILAFAKKNDRILIYDVKEGMFRLQLLIQDD